MRQTSRSAQVKVIVAEDAIDSISRVAQAVRDESHALVLHNDHIVHARKTNVVILQINAAVKYGLRKTGGSGQIVPVNTKYAFSGPYACAISQTAQDKGAGVVFKDVPVLTVDADISCLIVLDAVGHNHNAFVIEEGEAGSTR